LRDAVLQLPQRSRERWRLTGACERRLNEGDVNAYQEIIALLGSEVDIPRERVLNWIDSKDLEIWAVLYVLTDEAYWRIKPELGMVATCNLIGDYLLRCLAENPDAGDYIHSGYEAAWEL